MFRTKKLKLIYDVASIRTLEGNEIEIIKDSLIESNLEKSEKPYRVTKENYFNESLYTV